MSAAWPRVSFGEVARLERRPVTVIADRQYQEIGTYSYGRGIFHKQPRSGLEVGNKDLFLMKEGDLILQVTFAWEGAIALCSEAEDGLYGSVRYPTFRVNDDRCFAPFLAKYLCTPPGLGQVARICPGSAGRNRVLAIKRLPEIMIPLPPVDEQRRIVARIEQLASKVTEACRLRSRLSRERIALQRSITCSHLTKQTMPDYQVHLPEVVGAKRRNVEIPAKINAAAAAWEVPKGWLRISVAELLLRGALLDVKDGNHGSNHPKSAEFSDHGTPFLMASDIIDEQVHWESAAFLPEAAQSRLRIGFSQPGDVLFTHKASIGRTAVSDRASILSPQVTYYRCNPNYILPSWLKSFLGSDLFLSQLSGIQKQSTRDFVSIGKQYQQFLLLPPLEEQTRIVRDLEIFRAKVEALSALQGETARELDAMLPAILDKAFKGEL